MTGSSLADMFMRVSCTLICEVILTIFRLKPLFRAVIRTNFVAIVKYGVYFVTGMVVDTLDSYITCNHHFILFQAALSCSDSSQCSHVTYRVRFPPPTLSPWSSHPFNSIQKLPVRKNNPPAHESVEWVGIDNSPSYRTGTILCRTVHCTVLNWESYTEGGGDMGSFFHWLTKTLIS